MESKHKYIKTNTHASDIGNYSPNTATQIENWLHIGGDLDDFIFYNFGFEDYPSEITK